MDIIEYQEKAKRTVNTNLQDDEQLANLCMGLCGESGEVVDYLKKCLYHGHKIEKAAFEKNLKVRYMNLLKIYFKDKEDTNA